MNTSIATFSRCRTRAFTLPEMVIAMAVFIMVTGGIIANHLTGMKMHYLVSAKLGVSEDARRALNLLMDEIQSCDDFKVGGGVPGAFIAAADGQDQAGSALRIYPTTNTAGPVIHYFLDTEDPENPKLVRMADGKTSVVAEYLTNQVVFREETFGGVVLRASEPRSVLGITLHFSQLQFPKAAIGTNQLFEYYRFQTKIGRRILKPS